MDVARKRNARKNMTPEEQDAQRARNKESMRNARENMTPEEQDALEALQVAVVCIIQSQVASPEQSSCSSNLCC